MLKKYNFIIFLGFWKWPYPCFRYGQVPVSSPLINTSTGVTCNTFLPPTTTTTNQNAKVKTSTLSCLRACMERGAKSSKHYNPKSFFPHKVYLHIPYLIFRKKLFIVFPINYYEREKSNCYFNDSIFPTLPSKYSW